jgi:hypothetical protein
MRTPTRISILFIVLLFVAFNAFPALASTPAPMNGGATAKITIMNKSGGPVEVKLSGPARYTILAQVGKTTLQVNKGEYTYTYKLCGAEQKGRVESGSKLAITACPTAKIAIFNFTPDFMTLVFSGDNNYSFTLPPGKSRITVIAGVYRITAYYCGETEGVTVNLLRGKWYGAYACEKQKK